MGRLSRRRQAHPGAIAAWEATRGERVPADLLSALARPLPQNPHADLTATELDAALGPIPLRQWPATAGVLGTPDEDWFGRWCLPLMLCCAPGVAAYRLLADVGLEYHRYGWLVLLQYGPWLAVFGGLAWAGWQLTVQFEVTAEPCGLTLRRRWRRPRFLPWAAVQEVGQRGPTRASGPCDFVRWRQGLRRGQLLFTPDDPRAAALMAAARHVVAARGAGRSFSLELERPVSGRGLSRVVPPVGIPAAALSLSQDRTPGGATAIAQKHDPRGTG